MSKAFSVWERLKKKKKAKLMKGNGKLPRRGKKKPYIRKKEKGSPYSHSVHSSFTISVGARKEKFGGGGRGGTTNLLERLRPDAPAYATSHLQGVRFSTAPTFTGPPMSEK